MVSLPSSVVCMTFTLPDRIVYMYSVVSSSCSIISFFLNSFIFILPLILGAGGMHVYAPKTLSYNFV